MTTASTEDRMVAEMIGKFAPDKLKDNGYVTERLMAECCPACGAGDLLTKPGTLTVCQICALRCYHATPGVWAADLPAPPRPALPLRVWFAYVLVAYDKHPEGHGWTKYLAQGHWMEQWRRGWDQMRAMLWHRCKEIGVEKKTLELVRPNWPPGLWLGHILGDSAWLMWHVEHPQRTELEKYIAMAGPNAVPYGENPREPLL